MGYHVVFSCVRTWRCPDCGPPDEADFLRALYATYGDGASGTGNHDELRDGSCGLEEVSRW